MGVGAVASFVGVGALVVAARVAVVAVAERALVDVAGILGKPLHRRRQCWAELRD